MTTARILPGLPGVGPVPEAFSATGRGRHSEGLVVEFSSSGGPWVGNFQPGMSEFNALLPQADGLAVIAGGQAYVVDIETRKLIRTFGGTISFAANVPATQSQVFTNGLWVESHGACCWRSHRISWDGMADLRVEGTVLLGTAYSRLDGSWTPFSIDLLTGEADGGSYNGPDAGAV